MTCAVCGLIGDQVSIEDPWDDLENMPPDYRAWIAAIDSLKDQPSPWWPSSDTLVSCPVCGSLYFRDIWSLKFGSNDLLVLERLTPEQERWLRPLLERQDEDGVRAALAAACDRDDAGVQRGVDRLIEALVRARWDEVSIPRLVALAFHARPARRAFVCEKLRYLALGEERPTALLWASLEAMGGQPWPPEVFELVDLLTRPKPR